MLVITNWSHMRKKTRHHAVTGIMEHPFVFVFFLAVLQCGMLGASILTITIAKGIRMLFDVQGESIQGL